MELFSWLFGLFGGRSGQTSDRQPDSSLTTRPERITSTDAVGKPNRLPPKIRSRPRLVPSAQHEALRRRQQVKQPCLEVAGASPYRFARFGSRTGQYLDLSDDGDETLLGQCGLPVFHGLPLN
jgi:hypothetical protein